MRVSNFLLWQIAYAEIWVTDALWPDFRARHLLEALVDYQKRDRRYGGVAAPGDPVIARSPEHSRSGRSTDRPLQFTAVHGPRRQRRRPDRRARARALGGAVVGDGRAGGDRRRGRRRRAGGARGRRDRRSRAAHVRRRRTRQRRRSRSSVSTVRGAPLGVEALGAMLLVVCRSRRRWSRSRSYPPGPATLTYARRHGTGAALRRVAARRRSPACTRCSVRDPLGWLIARDRRQRLGAVLRRPRVRPPQARARGQSGKDRRRRDRRPRRRRGDWRGAGGAGDCRASRPGSRRWRH